MIHKLAAYVRRTEALFEEDLVTREADRRRLTRQLKGQAEANAMPFGMKVDWNKLISNTLLKGFLAYAMTHPGWMPCINNCDPQEHCELVFEVLSVHLNDVNILPEKERGFVRKERDGKKYAEMYMYFYIQIDFTVTFALGCLCRQ